MNSNLRTVLLVAAGLSLSSTNVQAQDDSESNFIPIDVDDKVVVVKGWDKYLNLGLYGTISENRNVVGKDDGQSTTLGLKIGGALDYGNDQHHWMNSLNVLISYSRSPLIPQYIKSEDTIDLDSIYKRYLKNIKWAGLFVQGGISTAGFAGYDTQPAIITYRRINLNGTEEVFESKRIKLTDSFLPLKFRESAGVIASPINTDALSWDIKAGVGFRQVQADDQYVIQDDDTTPEKEIVEIESFEKAGYELGTEVSGSLEDKKVTYSLKANVLFPFYESFDDEGKTTFDKRVVDVTGKASFHLLSWASADYLLTVTRDPGITEKAQVSQSVLFSLNKTIAERRTPPKE